MIFIACGTQFPLPQIEIKGIPGNPSFKFSEFYILDLKILELFFVEHVL
jgi:hypothetical protein